MRDRNSKIQELKLQGNSKIQASSSKKRTFALGLGTWSFLGAWKLMLGTL